MMLNPGQELSNFKVVRKLGEGGMGEVYLVEDTKLHRQVALKILLAEFLANDDRMSRFRREAQTAAQVNHPNVMAIYEFDSFRPEGSDQDLTCIVSEYVAGQPLMEYINSRHPNLSELLKLAQKTASGLAAAHKLNIVHRDIKSENILIDDQGEPKILDFGLAKPIEPVMSGGDSGSTNTISQELTQEGKILGTISYMSPEQARGDKIDTRSDIFSFGILLYKMFTGVSPFEGPDRVSVLAKILEGRAAPLRQYNEAAPAELQRIIDKCLQKDPRDRYQDTRDLVLDLRTLRRQYDSGISETLSTTSTETPAYRPPKSGWSTWKKVLMGVGIAAVTAVFAMVAITAIFFSQVDPDLTTDEHVRDAMDIARQVQQSLSEAGIDVAVEFEPGDALRIPGLAARTNAMAILGFENKTGDAELDWLSAGLPEILLTDLSQGTDLHLISRLRVLDCLTPEERADPNDPSSMPSHQACVEAARGLGASRVMSGSFYKLGEQIRIDARIEDARSGQIVLAEKVVGADPFQLVDSLTHKIASSLDMAKSDDADRDVAAITTTSTEAYKHYILGMEMFADSRLDESREEFLRATEIDSTFALAYMRIGMAYAFRGRAQQAIPYLQAAMQYQDRLPAQFREQLEIYADLWIRIQFDDALAKLKRYVADYPDDKEVRAFWAILQHQLEMDSDAAIAQLDTVMMLDPKYYWGLSFYSDIYNGLDQNDKAIEYARLLKAYHPKALAPYSTLAGLYMVQDRMDDAVAECEELLQLDPGNEDALVMLNRIAILERRFDDAQEYCEMLLEHHSDDHMLVLRYHQDKANLAQWRGRFHEAIDHYLKALDLAYEVGDSSQVSGRCNSLAAIFERIGQDDSCLHYSRIGWQWASRFEFFNYPIDLAVVDPANCDSARALFQQAMDNFKSRVPEQLWHLANNIQDVFEGICRVDSALLLDGYRRQANSQMGQSADKAQLGKLLVLNGEYEEAIEVLQPLLAGDDETSGGYRYVTSTYYLARTEEALGNTDRAIKGYRKVLEFWRNADTELEELVGARQRLAELTS